MSTSAQPNQLPFADFQMEDVVAVEPGLGAINPANIVAQGTTFQLLVHCRFGGAWAWWFTQVPYNVTHIFAPIAGGASFQVNGTLTWSPNLEGRSNMTITTGPGGQLPVGAYRVTTLVRPPAPASATVSAFSDGLVIEVTPV